MTYAIKETISAPLTFRSGDNHENITNVRVHTIAVTGTVEISVEVNNSGEFISVGEFTDEVKILNGYQYTALQITPTGTATIAMGGYNEER